MVGVHGELEIAAEACGSTDGVAGGRFLLEFRYAQDFSRGTFVGKRTAFHGLKAGGRAHEEGVRFGVEFLLLGRCAEARAGRGPQRDCIAELVASGQFVIQRAAEVGVVFEAQGTGDQEIFGKVLFQVHVQTYVVAAVVAFVGGQEACEHLGACSNPGGGIVVAIR